MEAAGANRRSGTKRTQPRSARDRRSQRRRERATAIGRAVCEAFEPRVLLSSTLDAQIPQTIPVDTGIQTLLAPSDNTSSLLSNSTFTASSVAYRFVLNNASAGQTTLFTARADPSSIFPADSAIALYDASGNRLALQDTDTGPTESLAIALQSGQKYTVEFFALAQSNLFFSLSDLDINPGPQTISHGLTLSPATGTVSRTTSSAPDAFTESSDVRYFSLNMLDAGQTGTVTLKPFGPDTVLDAALFQQATAGGLWTQIATTTLAGGASSTTMNITPPSGEDITDASYELAIAPLNFTSAPAPATISVAASLLSPATVSPSSAHLGIRESLSSIGTLSGSGAGSFSGQTPSIADLIAPVAGTMTVTYTPTTDYAPLLGIYGPGGTALLNVISSKFLGSSVSTTFTAKKGSDYYFSAGADDGSASGSFTIAVTQAYTPSAISAGSSVGTKSALALAPTSGSTAYQLTPAAGSNYLAMQLAPDSGSSLQTQISLIGPGSSVQTFTASGVGVPLNVVVDESVTPGPYDVVLNGIAGTGTTATFKYVSLTTPTSIAVNQFSTSYLNLATGGLTSSSLAVTTGQPIGLQYFQPATNAPLSLSTYTATSSGGAAAVLLHYVQNGSVFKLAEAKAPSTLGIASVSDVTRGQVLQALVALSVNFSGTGTVQFGVTGPLPKGTALAEVPNALPDVTMSTYQSTVSVTAATITASTQLDLYSVQLPFNLLSTSSTLGFTPIDVGGPLHATVSVLNSSNISIASATNTAGQPLTIPVTGLTAGETLRFLVQPVAGSNVGSGKYTFSMTVNTTNPLPYLVKETAFYPYVAPASQISGESYFPNVAPTVIDFGSTGGSATGDFNSSINGGTGGVPYNNNGTGSVQVFEINDFTVDNPFQIYTTDTDPNVNTNFSLYIASGDTDASGNPSYIHLPGTGPSFDYYPGDRTQVDSKIVVNNMDLDPTIFGGEFPESVTIYAVVMNEQGTQGSYTLTAAPAPATTTGPGVATGANVLPMSPASGSQYLAPTIETTNGTTYVLRTTANLGAGNSTLTVRTEDGSTGQAVRVLVIKLFGVFGTSYTGTIGPGGIANISIGVGKSAFYDVSVTITSGAFPAAGLGLSLSVPLVSPSGPVPTSIITNVPQDAAFNSAIPRLEPGPDGSLSSTFTLSGGEFSTVFNVETGAGVTLHVAYAAGSTGVAVGLYQMGMQGSGANNDGPYTSVGMLLDYVNTTDANGNYSLTEELQPGTYMLSGTGTVPSGTQKATVTGTTPAVLATVLNVEPSNGDMFNFEDSIVNQGQGPLIGPDNNFPFVSNRYRTAFFATTVPSNTNGQPISVEVYDNPANLDPSSVGVGTVSLTLWRFANGVYTKVGSKVNALNDHASPATDVSLTATDTPVAGAVYFIGVDLNSFSSPVYVTVKVPVNATGTPDYSVTPLQLLPNFGQTLVETTVVDGSFTAAEPTTYTVQLGGTTVTRDIPALAPFGTYLISIPWTPLSPSDIAQVIVNPGNLVPELSAANDATQAVPLSTVDDAVPQVSITLSDPLMTAEGAASPGVDTDGNWGRYISGVKGQTATIIVTGFDSDLLEVDAQGPIVGTKPVFSIYSPIGSNTAQTTLDFGSLGTNSTNDLIHYYAIDDYGLRSQTYLQSLDVIAAPSYLTGGIPAAGTDGSGGAISFAAATHSFTVTFQDSLISHSDTLSDLLSFTVPLIGDTQNSFVVSIIATGTGGLDPTVDIPLVFNANVTVEVVGETVLNKNFPAPVGNPNFVFTAQSLLDGRTLIPGSASIDLQMSKLNLGTVKSPLIPLATIGVPGIASIDAGVKFSIGATLNLAAKLGLDQTSLDSSGFLGSIGLMSPTFIQPAITATASIVGQAEVLGFDFATVTGSIGLTLSLTLGLDNDVPGAIIPFSDAGSHVATSIDVSLTVGVAASIPIIGNIFTYNYTLGTENIVNTIEQGIFLTDPPSFAAGKFLPPSVGGSLVPQISSDTTAVISSGTSMVGSTPVDGSPQIVINPTTGMGLSVQVKNVAAAGNPPLGNLAFSTRTNSSSTWSALSTLTEANDDSDPVLAMSNDGASGSTPAVVVYDTDDTAGAPASQTFNQRMDASDLRYRYFNGSTWGPEIALTSDSLFDSQQSTAFDAKGDGVLAFVHNTDSAPMNSSGVFDSAANDIQASVWNPTTHTWSAPVAITSGNGVDDSQPTTFVDATGKRYIVWIQTTGTTTQLMFSTSTGTGAWSTPAPLSISGLAAGGTFKRVAIGSDGSGRVNVIFSYSTTNADGTMTNILYERPAKTTTFTSTLPAVQIAQNADFSSLKTTSAPTGALVVYWEQSDGQVNQIFESTIMQGVASTPTQVTDDPNVASEPTAAVDTSGTLQVLYDNSVVYGGTSQGSPTDPTVGAPMAAGVASSSIQDLPQLTFTTGLTFPIGSQTSATIGSQLTGTAVIANRGLAAASVTITAFDGLPATGTAVGSQTVNLLPGASYNVSQIFDVLAGNQTYSLQLTTGSGQAFDTTENVSSTTLDGLVDIDATQLKTDSGTASPGQSVTLYDDFQNMSNSAIGPFVVTFYSGDPLSPQSPLTVLGSDDITGLAASASGSASFGITVPATAGDFIYTAVVDSGNAITESNENNNETRFEVIFQGDPALVDPGTGAGAVTATLLNSSTSNNVGVVVNVENFGEVTMTNIPVDLQVSRNGGAFTSAGQMVIASLDPGASSTETFTLTSLAGDNLYVASIDPSVYPEDSVITNDQGSAELIVPGLPALVGTATLSSGTTAAGAALTLNTTVKNNGLADATAVPVVVLASLTSGGPSYNLGTAAISVSGLGTQATAISLNTAGLAAGQYTVTFEIDPSQSIVQSSEAGNTFTLPLVITGGIVLGGTAEYLRLDNDGQTLDIWNATTDSGSPSQQFTVAGIISLSVAASSGTQLLTVDFSNGDPLPAVGMSFTGPIGGANTLTIIGSTGNDSLGVSVSKATFNNATVSASITYTNAKAINYIDDGGADTLTQTSQPGGGAALAFINSTSLDTLNVDSGTFTFPAASPGSGITPVTLGTLKIVTGTSVSLADSIADADRTVLVLGSLSISTSGGIATGKLDLGANDMIVRNGGSSLLTKFTGFLKTGFNAGLGYWNGATGIVSSAAAGDSTFLTTLGIMQNTSGNPFDNQTSNIGDILIKHTYYGDADLNGTVNAADYQLIEGGIGTHAATWAGGDFNYDGVVNGTDYSLIDNASNQIKSQGLSPLAMIASSAISNQSINFHAPFAGTFSNGSPIPDTAAFQSKSQLDNVWDNLDPNDYQADNGKNHKSPARIGIKSSEAFVVWKGN
jgi:hypothetical protein